MDGGRETDGRERLLGEQLDGIVATLSTLAKDLEQIRAALRVQPNDVDPASGAKAADWGTMGQAAQIRKSTIETMTKHVIAQGLGVKRRGTWRVDLNRVRAWIEGDDDFEPLDPFPDEAR